MALTTFTSGQVLTAAQLNAVQANDYNQTVSTKIASYTLVAADKGTRVVMNSASATTITVNTSLFSAGDTLVLQNIGAGVTTVTAGTATVSSAGPLAIPQYGSGTLYFTSAGVAIFLPSAGPAASSGLTFISSTTPSSTSFTISNCFSATYDNYLILFSNVTKGTSPGKFRLRLGSGTAHAFNLQFISFSGASYNTDTNASSGNFINLDAGYTTAGGSLTINSPFLVTPTTVGGLTQTNSELNIVQGIETSSTSFTDITFSNTNAVNFTGGTVKLFGYANS
ncbi:MAG: hypothetical protein ACRCR7_00035 [Weissella cibaria]